jgi:hypothetical protein
VLVARLRGRKVVDVSRHLKFPPFRHLKFPPVS